ncbi:hypothetical protein CI109_103704 [Kwoniella shandongensis]|uniref:Uncharacterized protein n=1 Tax=Kwoniella shandongensis TaxID=1734106 RepID=A0A5M6C7C2_9TREE|nr:uncharacterized protein CI109_000599 [Kwoniella shandongensis]KAA5531027.1 hypothetical protein CI109_000599 [Kwoniella shandongensis]
MATRRSSSTTIRIVGDTEKKMVNGKRKSVIPTKEVDDGEPDKKKRKQGGSKKPAFNPKPVPLPNSSDTPPDDNELPLELGPPPSEKRPARRRESTRAIRERQQSASPPPGLMLNTNTSTTSKKPKSRGKSIEPVRGAIGTADDPLAGVEETASMRNTNTRAPAPLVENLRFSTSARPRPSAPRPTSPPRRTFAGSASSTAGAGSSKLAANMGPPTGAFVRKTRKSMSRLQELSKESVVPVMESETPVIRKNQELRGAQARRSSLDHRGGRASSSWGKGEITMPHKSVDHKLFYRHIPTAYPDPIKARMLLVWCANRAVDEALKPVKSSSSRSKGKEKEVRSDEGDKMIREIMDEFVQKMNRGAVDTSSVLGTPGQDSAMSGLKPHPRNVTNRKVESDTLAAIRKYKEEGSHWSALINAANTKQQEVIRKLEKKKALDAEPDMSQAEGWMRQALSVAERVISEGEGDLEAMGEFTDVEYKVDLLQQSSHVALQYSLQASRFLDGIFSSLTSDLRAREGLGLPSELPPHDTDGPDTTSLLVSTRPTSTSQSQSQSKPKTDPISLLRALASAESKGQSEETVAAAAKVAPMPAMTPRRPTAGMTPRRPGTSTVGGGASLAPGTTPRRGGAYGRGTTSSAE